MMQENMELGRRIKAERERKKLSQYKLAQAIGWNHHQIVSEVEQGKREIKARELYEISKFLSIDVDVLLGNKEKIEEPFVLWREKPTEDEEFLKERFLRECNNYLWVEQMVAHSSDIDLAKKLPQIRIPLQEFSLEQAYQLAETLRQQMALGDFPAAQLIDILEDRYEVKFIVAQDDIKPSGACFRSEKGCFIFINGRQAEARQLFSIAHELFHLLTWDVPMLKEIDSHQHLHEKNELLANAFAAGLLIPQEKLLLEVKKMRGGKLLSSADVLALAQQFQVSKEAMLHRMQNISLISKKEYSFLLEQLQRVPYVPTLSFVHPLKARFVRLVYLACEHVKISRAKAAKILNIELGDLSHLFNEYGFIEIPC